MLFKQPTRYRRDLLMGPKPSPRKTVLNVKARLNSQRLQQKKQVCAGGRAHVLCGSCSNLGRDA
jgi:hypothetical protein